MALRRGGKKLAMEDVCYYQWPLPGIDQVLSIISFLDIYLHTSNGYWISNFPCCSLECLAYVMDMEEQMQPHQLAS